MCWPSPFGPRRQAEAGRILFFEGAVPSDRGRPWQNWEIEKCLSFVVGICLLLFSAELALAQSEVEIQVARQAVAMPSAEKIVILVRNSLITLNGALRTGNYTVLRDIGAPGFREANSAARLSQIFSNLLTQEVDLSAVAVVAPQLTQQPVLDQEKGMLHLKGYFPGEPMQINFELLYQAVNGQWRLFGISVQPGPSQDAAEASRANPDTR